MGKFKAIDCFPGDRLLGTINLETPTFEEHMGRILLTGRTVYFGDEAIEFVGGGCFDPSKGDTLVVEAVKPVELGGNKRYSHVELSRQFRVGGAGHGGRQDIGGMEVRPVERGEVFCDPNDVGTIRSAMSKVGWPLPKKFFR